MQRNEVALRQQLFQGHQFDRNLVRRRFADVRVVRQHAHVKRPGAHRDFTADSPEANQAQSLSPHFRSRRRGFFPAPLMNCFVQSRDLPRQGQKQSAGVLRDADGIPARCAHHQHAALGSRFQIDVVHAHTGAPHRAQFSSLV